MKFKIGQKVCVKKWLDMPQDLQDIYGMNTYGIGFEGVIEKFNGVEHGVNYYNVLVNGTIHCGFE